MTVKSLQPQAAPVFCGLAGWSYPDWQGYVYDRTVKDKLQFLARYVDVIEINSTFYRPPDARTAASWARRTAGFPDFFFTAKLHRDITHRGRIESGTVKAFHEGLEPLLQNNKLRHLLAQFRWDFADSPWARDYVSRIQRAFGDITNLTFELRHNSWQSPAALDFMGSLNVNVANLDYPLARNSFNLRCCRVGQHAYFRLHGRNAKAWFDKTAGRDQTYNYAYSDEEIAQITGRAVAIAKGSQTLTVIANNHYQGKEALNALEIKARLSGQKVPVPPALLRRYPQLEKIAQ